MELAKAPGLHGLMIQFPFLWMVVCSLCALLLVQCCLFSSLLLSSQQFKVLLSLFRWTMGSAAFGLHLQKRKIV
jgi:hypothetical protein